MAKRHNTWFYKFLISYILLLMIPLIILGVLFVSSIDGFYKERVLQAENNEVASLELKLGSEFNTITDIVKQISLVGLVPDGYSFEESPLYANQIKTILKTYVIPSSFYDGIFYYQFDQDYLYSNGSTFKKDLFFDNIYINGESKDVLQSRLQEIRRPTSFRIGNDLTYKMDLVIAFPLINYTGGSDGVVMFAFTESRLTRFLEQTLFRDIGYEVTGNSQELLLSDVLESDVETREYEFRIDNVDWTLHLHIPVGKSVVKENVINFLPFFIAVLLVLLFSGMAIIFFMRRNYRPIGILHEQVKELGTVGDNYGSDEFKAISGTITELNSRNLDLKNELLSLQEERVNIELQKLVTGGFYNSYEEFISSNPDLIDISGPYFAFANLHFKEICSEIEELASRISKELSSDGIRCYYVYTPFPRRLYMIGNFDTEEDGRRFLDRLEPVRAEFEVEYGNTITIGTSSLKKGMESIPSLMLEAHSACEYRFIKGKGTLIRFEEINQKEGTAYPKESLNALKKAILSHDIDSIESCMDEFVEHMTNTNISLFEAQGICFEIMQTYLTANPEERKDDSLRKEMLEFSEIATAPDLVNKIREYCRKLNPTEEKCSQNEMDIITNAKVYVRENCLDCNFSAQDVAESIGMNVTKLSTLFSNVTGTCLVDYVSSIRMAAARKLLEETNMPIKEVSGKVGYYNVSSFIRRFHQIHGISPGDYRKRFSD